MFHSVLHFPVWQGGGARHGYGRGSALLRELAAQALPVVDFPVDDSDFSPARHGVVALDTLCRHFAGVREALAHMPAPVLTLGGDCVADYIPLARALDRHGEDLALVWVDAHPDINIPATSPSGHFHGMLVRALAGEGPDELTAFVGRRLDFSRLFYVGVRNADIDPEETRVIEAEKIFRLDVPQVQARAWEPLFAAIAARGCTGVYLHVDADVLDMTDYPEAVVAVPGGIPLAVLVSFLRALRARFPLYGGALTEYSVGSHGQTQRDLAHCLLSEGFGIG